MQRLKHQRQDIGRKRSHKRQNAFHDLRHVGLQHLRVVGGFEVVAVLIDGPHGRDAHARRLLGVETHDSRRKEPGRGGGMWK